MHFKNCTKRVIASLLVMLLLVSALPVGAFAVDNEPTATTAPVETTSVTTDLTDGSNIPTGESPESAVDDPTGTETPSTGDTTDTETPGTDYTTGMETPGAGDTTGTETPGTDDTTGTETPGTGDTTSTEVPGAGDTTDTNASDAVVIPVTGISLDQTSLKLTVMGESVTLTATVTPADATEQTIDWKTSDAEVATVADGVVTPGFVGEATITASIGDIQATCAVTVEPPEADVYAGEATYVLAASDFQARGGHDAGATIVSGLLAQIKETYPTMDGFLFAGDYDVNYSDSANGKAKLQETVQGVYGTGMDEIYIQGNHDGDGLVGSTLTASGANDAENYGVFVINEKDYMWYNDDEATIKKTAANLESYLNAKRNAGYTKPIFVISHLPLHYSMRTRSGGNDGMHANYIFDVLNEAGNAGLNIIFLFGHNHSHGWDDYLGGAAIFLTEGDKINIAQNSTTVFQEEKLAFTYMNAGYVGYYGDSYTSDVDKTLTMTIFAITDTDVTINRFDSDSTHDLKSAGVYNVEYPDSAYYSTDTTTVASPYTLTLNTEITPAGEEVEAPDTGSGTASSIEQVTSLEQGVPYIIVNDRSGTVLTNETITYDNNGTQTTLKLEGTPSVDTTHLWYYNGTNLIYGDPNSTSSYLLMATEYAYLGESHSYRMVDDVYLNNDGATFTLKRTDDNLYLNDYGNGKGVAAPYTADGNSDAGSKWRIYKLVEGSDTPTVDTTGGNWITLAEPTEAGTKYVYELDTNGVDTGVEYLIVANSYEKALSAAASSNNAVDIEISGNYAYATSDTYGWTFTRYSNGVYYIRLNGSTYLRVSDGALSSSNSEGSSRRWTVTSNSDGSYDVVRSDYNLRWSNSNGVFQASSSNEGPVRLYKYVKTETTTAQAGLYGKISGELTYNVAIGTSTEDAVAAVKAGIDVLYHTGDESAAQTFPDDGEGMTWTLNPSYDGTTPGEYAVTIAYNGVTLGVAKVVVPTVNITGYSVEPAEGTVNKGASQAANTGALLYVQLENGKYYTVPVTVGMLTKADGSAVSTGEIGTFKNLTLTYNGVVITENFTLNVVAKAGNNYPEYPNEGAVKVSKTGTGIDFQSSGIAQVEISASGVPMKKGADVIVMLDLSSSMSNTVDGKTRLKVMEESLEVLMTQLKANGEDGTPMDIRIAVADFNRYYTNSSEPYYINEADTVAGGSIRTNNSGTNQVYTGSGALNAGAFVSVHDLAVNEFSNFGYASGTNYDYAFDAVYQLGEAITQQNATDGVERDLFVIFMSDGAPFQFNYFSSQSDGTGAAEWNNWLTGTLDTADIDAGANATYYNEDGKHWMAEAIKGDPANTYPVIRKNNAADTDGDTWVDVNGLGAKMYSIGFCLAVDKQITVATMDTVIRNIASEEQYYFRANTASDLNNAFAAIGGDIAYAAYNARFVDQMGDDYSLQLKTSTYSVVDGGSTTSKTLAPVIEVLTYDIYTKAEADAGSIPTGKNIGDRKGTSTLKEVVKFSEDGTKAYSNLIDVDKDGTYGVTVNSDGTYTISDTDDNILGTDGVIYATTFLYNTNATGVAVDGVSIPTGVKADGTTTGSTNVLPSETFYWKMGTVQTSELAMRYYVYLEGSMEGTRDAGSYPTNEYATLYYDNYLGNPCKKDTVSPVMAWDEANVSYAFYLVDENGNIIVNQTTGKTGSFANKIAVTNPVVYETIKLNNLDEISSIEVASAGVLPAGYDLYDTSAKYTIKINSNTTGSWEIVQGANKVASTYVTQYKTNDASAYSNALTNSTVGDDYTHTVVWFAVLWKVQALPDTVVIDYGLPVDISVLTNDMFGENGKLAGVGAYSDSLNLDGHDTALASGFGDSYTGTYGTAAADTSTGKVRYTPNTMEMNGYDKFAYAVNYTGSENAGYYYDTVTVIPATTIYYEDSFVKFDNLTWQQKEGGELWEGDWVVDENPSESIWKQAGTTDSDATQQEDRPGQYALTDANNIYGYDAVNKDMSTYSLGSAMKATVDYDNAAQASFTFTGTGFDVISMTDNTTGTILVKVYTGTDITAAPVKNLSVDTYYGYKQAMCHVVYTYRDDEWVMTNVLHESANCTECVVSTVKPDTASEGDEVLMTANAWIEDSSVSTAIWQVPVMKVDGLDYGQYTAVIQAVYEPAFDHETTQTATTYDFYLDAIRIYDPANNGTSDGTDDTTIEDAYKADGEGWPSYFELRNQLITAQTLGNATTDTKITGEVFIDGDATVGDVQIEDYIGYGPNNEVYLNAGQSVAFLLDVPSNIANVHIGIKSADGNEVTYTIKNIARNTNSETGVKAGQMYNENVYTVSTTTDMYYDLTGWDNDIIVISNTGSTGILSLTNIKFTYTSDPNSTETASENDDSGLSVASADSLTVSGEGYAYMTPAAATLTLRSMNNQIVDVPDNVDPGESIPETTEPDETVPEEPTTPEDTDPVESEPDEPKPEESKPNNGKDKVEQAIKKALKEAAKKAAKELENALKKLFSGWF